MHSRAVPILINFRLSIAGNILKYVRIFLMYQFSKMRAHREHVLENGSRLRDNTSRIIVKREKTAVVCNIISHRLGKLLLALNSLRFLRPSLRSMYFYRFSYIYKYFPRRVYITLFVRFATSDRETETEICARNVEIREFLRDLLQPKTATMRLGRAASRL